MIDDVINATTAAKNDMDGRMEVEKERNGRRGKGGRDVRGGRDGDTIRVCLAPALSSFLERRRAPRERKVGPGEEDEEDWAAALEDASSIRHCVA